MKLIFVIVLVCLSNNVVRTVKLPGPLVYVVTPASRSKPDQGRASHFYYNNWMRRMDSVRNMTSTITTTTTVKPTLKTPDLIFAEFESDNAMQKSLRKLLEKERIKNNPVTSTTTMEPIHVMDNSNHEELQAYDSKKDDKQYSSSDMEDYFASYSPEQYPVTQEYYTPTPATTTTTSTTASPMKVENVWHIIDNEKYNQYNGDWEEVSANKDDQTQENFEKPHTNDKTNVATIDDNFALPGFTTNGDHSAENESRAIRTEPNIRFPYVSLKPFQMKTLKTPAYKGNNMFNLNNFQEMKFPVRGEAQDVVRNRDPIDRYNPAQPYLPQYGTNSKESNTNSAPVKAVGSLVPPPPPQPPKITDNDFPQPSFYESFPPYSSDGPDSSDPPAPAANPPPIVYKPPSPPVEIESDSPPKTDMQMDMGYRYKAPALPFAPTLPPPPVKPFNGYSYDKPHTSDSSDMDKPATGYHYPKPQAAVPDKPSSDYHPLGFDHHHDHHYPSHDDYPELIYNKPHKDVIGGDDMKNNDMDMVPPPPEPKPSDDHGFPPDFPGDLKYHHDIEDYYHDHHHHYHPTTTTTTTSTEMPRVNRYSYYYLGKKLYYLPLYFSVYFIVYVGALIIKAILRHKIVYPNSWRPNDTTAGFFSKRSVDSWNLSNERLHEITDQVTKAVAVAAEKYMSKKTKED